MKKIIYILTVIAITAIFSCKSGVDTKVIAGKWQKSTTDSVKLVLELTTENTWMYYKNDSLVEKGKFDLTADKFILKHEEAEHNHKEGEAHDHNHPENHEYTYTLNAEKTELSLNIEGKTSIYKKLQ